MSFNVLSLFDGISCGQIALEQAGVAYDRYYASEIDKHAIKVTQKNYPYTDQVGDVANIRVLPGEISLLLGGSPCQGFSSIGKGLNFEDPHSKLFFEFVRIMKEAEPKYFLLENVPMKAAYRDVISSYMGVEPIEINSSTVSAQNRLRLYWTNIPRKHLLRNAQEYLDDVIDHSYTGYRVPLNWEKRVPADLPKYCDPYNKKEIKHKSTALRTNVNNGNMWIRVPDGYRNLSRREAEKLQTVPAGYTDAVSESQAKKMLGNGWTVAVISHLLRGIKCSEES